jgi:uncharacterized protein involved in exopolysaccharide biosynthesis
MRALFSLLGLLLVVALVGFMAKKQLQSTATLSVKPPEGVVLPQTTPGATVQQQSQQITQQVKQSVEAAMQQARPASDEQ